MRPKFVLLVGLVALLVLGAAFFVKSHMNSAVPATAPPEAANHEPTTSASITTIRTPKPRFVSLASAPAESLTPEQRQTAIDAETDRLQQLSMSDAPDDLFLILADLTNPEKEIRYAAIEATEQFGSTNAIPTLQAVALNAADPAEKAALLEAADFLALPSLSDLAAKNSPPTPDQILADQQYRSQQLAKHPPQTPPATVPPVQNPPLNDDNYEQASKP